MRAEISAARQAQRAARKEAQDEADANFQASQADKEVADTQQEIDPQKVLFLGAGLVTAIGATIGVSKAVAWYKHKKAEKATKEESSTDPVTSDGAEG